MSVSVLLDRSRSSIALLASHDRATFRPRIVFDRTSRPCAPSGPPAPPQLQQVVRPADHLPFRLTVAQPTLHEAVDPPTRLGLAEYRLDDLAPPLVQAPSSLRQQLAVHPLTRAQIPGDAPPRWRCLTHLLPLLPVLARRHEQLRSVGISLLQV